MATPEEAFAVRLNQTMKKAGLKGPADLAKVTGLNRVTLGAYLRGNRLASLEACITIGNALKASPMWLYTGRDELQDVVLRGAKRKEYTRPSPNAEPVQTPVAAPKARQIPLYSAVLAGPDGSVVMSQEMIDMIEAPPPVSGAANAYAIRVLGDSMEPRYFSGEIVYVHPSAPVKKGDFVVAQITEAGNEYVVAGYVKRFVSIDDRKLVLEQLNPKKTISFPRNRVKTLNRVVASSG